VGLKKQLELANKLKADFVVIIGEDEKKNRRITLKDMRTGKQESINFPQLAHEHL
jgi:histidyl-tRNA synthetase